MMVRYLPKEEYMAISNATQFASQYNAEIQEIQTKPTQQQKALYEAEQIQLKQLIDIKFMQPLLKNQTKLDALYQQKLALKIDFARKELFDEADVLTAKEKQKLYQQYWQNMAQIRHQQQVLENYKRNLLAYRQPLNQLIQTLEALKNPKECSMAEKIVVLKKTSALLEGKLSAPDYLHLASHVYGKHNIPMLTIGIIMYVLGLSCYFGGFISALATLNPYLFLIMIGTPVFFFPGVLLLQLSEPKSVAKHIVDFENHHQKFFKPFADMEAQQGQKEADAKFYSNPV